MSDLQWELDDRAHRLAALLVDLGACRGGGLRVGQIAAEPRCPVPRTKAEYTNRVDQTLRRAERLGLVARARSSASRSGPWLWWATDVAVLAAGKATA